MPVGVRERERGRVSVNECVFECEGVRERGRVSGGGVGVYACVGLCVLVCGGRGNGCDSGSVCEYECMCMSERVREIERIRMCVKKEEMV